MVQVEAQVRAGEIIEGIVHLGDSPTIKLCASGRVLSIGNLWSGRFGKEGQDTRAFLGRHQTEITTILVENWSGGGKALIFEMIEHIQLVLDIGQGSPLEAVGVQVISNARDSFYPVGMVEPTRVELALSNRTNPKTRQDFSGERSGRQDGRRLRETWRSSMLLWG